MSASEERRYVTGMQEQRDLFDREALVHLPELLRVCTRLVGDRPLGQDLVQEAFLQGWRSFHRYRAGTNCRAWLYRILFLVLAEHRRREARMPLVVSLDENVEDAASISTCAFRTPVVLNPEDVRAALARLPEPSRLVIILADVEDHTYREMAEELGIPIGTVMSRLSRARHMLREELSKRSDGKLRLFRRL